jgi:choline kinase
MRAIILSAGQGRRLLPLTADTPKCLLPVDAGRPVIELQLETLARCGINSVTVMLGFGADKVEAFLAQRRSEGLEVRTLYNPFVATTDNLITCWLARSEMTEDFVLLNGDTIFEPLVLRRLLTARPAPIALAIDRKDEYADDDMKVTLGAGTQLEAVAKTIPRERIDGESIGLIAFRDQGVELFRNSLDVAIRDPAALHRWYLSVIDAMARTSTVDSVLIKGLWWMEIDSPADLAEARANLARRAARHAPASATSPTLPAAAARTLTHQEH